MKASNKEARRWFLQSVDDYQFVKWVYRVAAGLRTPVSRKKLCVIYRLQKKRSS